jgi:hypothetical protein
VRRAGTPAELLAGLPVIRLRTASAVPVSPRSVPLVTVVTTEVFAVLGGSIGGFPTRAWPLLLADPTADQGFRGRRPVRARQLGDPVRQDVPGRGVG